MAVDKDLWIDLHSLSQGSFVKDGYIVFFFQYNEKIPRNDSIMYLMRKAIRAVGFNITKLCHIFGEEGWTMSQEEYHTDIPEALGTSKAYNEWVGKVVEELAPH